MATNIQQFIQTISELHNDGMRLKHFARYRGRETERERSTMPVSAFVYQFFLYNTLYSIDWEGTQAAGTIVHHPRTCTERTQQHRFEEFMQKLAKDNPRVLQKSFERLTKADLSGTWTCVVPDSKITQQDGEEFFRCLQELVQLTVGTENEVKSRTGKIFSGIRTCRGFVYDVRNNIFHGTKTLGDIRDLDQRKRIHVYYLFLNCLVSGFLELANTVRFNSLDTHS